MVHRHGKTRVEKCRPDARVMILGPTPPLSPAQFRYGISDLSGPQVVDEDTGLRTIRPGPPACKSKVFGLW